MVIWFRKIFQPIMVFWQTIIFSVSLSAFLTLKAFFLFSVFFPRKFKLKTRKLANIFYSKVLIVCNGKKKNGIGREGLIDLAFRNMTFKKSRTFITVGGMAVGISTIVFLVSLGYGVQELVVSRVAKLDEMKQVDVTSQAGTGVKIDDETLLRIKDFSDVEKALPLISVVGTVNYQNSSSDMAVYGVTADYLKHSEIRPVKGVVFESNETYTSFSKKEADRVVQIELKDSETEKNEIQVAGSSDKAIDKKEEVRRGYWGQEKKIVNFGINPGQWRILRSDTSKDSKIIGYTKRIEGVQRGLEVLGDSYEGSSNGNWAQDENEQFLGRWICSKVPIWNNQVCEEEKDKDCYDGKYKIKRDIEGFHVQQYGCFALIDVSIEDNRLIDETKVLGTETQAEMVDISEVDWLGLETNLTGGVDKSDDVKEVEIASSAERKAVVNRAMIKVLGIEEEEAVGKIFEVSFVAIGELLNNNDEKIRSSNTPYQIVGVTPDDKTPLFYVPFIDLRSMGIVNYSQIKVVASSKEALFSIRKKIEGIGFVTDSVVDTVNQINSLFGTARVVLALVGMVALAVASLGMFNTLTVSLLERTREVGLMKAMGMRSDEIKELFLIESMMMGFTGGVCGIFIGYVAGKFLGLSLSAFSVFQGVGFLDVTHIPMVFIFLVLGLSLFVGVVTGIYPARRAKKISALNALRYE